MHRFGHWAHLSKVMRPDTWRDPRRVGEILASFAACVCDKQRYANRRFILENPAGSGIFSLACMKDLWGAGNVVSINAQCAIGLSWRGANTQEHHTLG